MASFTLKDVVKAENFFNFVASRSWYSHRENGF